MRKTGKFYDKPATSQFIFQYDASWAWHRTPSRISGNKNTHPSFDSSSGNLFLHRVCENMCEW
jgi:hypothetical protein